MKTEGLATRFATAFVVLPVVLALVWVPDLRIGLNLFVAAVACVGLFEYYALIDGGRKSPETFAGILGGAFVAFSGGMGDPVLTNTALAAACVTVALLVLVRGRFSLSAVVAYTVGVAYVGWFAAHALMLHGVPEYGPGLFTVLLATVAATDTAAYFVGSQFGKHKLAPKLSPNKTWEGAAGGLVFALVCMSALYGVQRQWGLEALPGWPMGRYLLVGIALSVASQAGDLAESKLKRSAGVKDSGVAFPGHGGVLDRCDGFLFAAPVLYYIAIP